MLANHDMFLKFKVELGKKKADLIKKYTKELKYWQEGAKEFAKIKNLKGKESEKAIKKCKKAVG